MEKVVLGSECLNNRESDRHFNVYSKLITKFSKVIGYHQLDLSISRTCVMLVIGQCYRTVKGTVHTSCMCN